MLFTFFSIQLIGFIRAARTLKNPHTALYGLAAAYTMLQPYRLVLHAAARCWDQLP